MHIQWFSELNKTLTALHLTLYQLCQLVCYLLGEQDTTNLGQIKYK
jgi:hypothetical protein